MVVFGSLFDLSFISTWRDSIVELPVFTNKKGKIEWIKQANPATIILLAKEKAQTKCSE